MKSLECRWRFGYGLGKTDHRFWKIFANMTGSVSISWACHHSLIASVSLSVGLVSSGLRWLCIEKKCCQLFLHEWFHSWFTRLCLCTQTCVLCSDLKTLFLSHFCSSSFLISWSISPKLLRYHWASRTQMRSGPYCTRIALPGLTCGLNISTRLVFLAVLKAGFSDNCSLWFIRCSRGAAFSHSSPWWWRVQTSCKTLHGVISCIRLSRWCSSWAENWWDWKFSNERIIGRAENFS